MSAGYPAAAHAGGGTNRRRYQDSSSTEPLYQNVVSPQSSVAPTLTYGTDEFTSQQRVSTGELEPDGRPKDDDEEDEEEQQSSCCCGRRKRCTRKEFMFYLKKIVLKLLLFLVVKVVAIELMRKGLRSLDDCPAEPLLPVFLGVSSIDILLVCFLRLIQRMLKLPCWNSCVRGGGMEGVSTVYDNFMFVFVDIFQSAFTAIWIICGSVWVFRIYKPQFEHPHLPDYCRRDIYIYAFVFLVFAYIGVALVAFFFVFRRVTGRRFHAGAVFRRARSSDPDVAEP